MPRRLLTILLLLSLSTAGQLVPPEAIRPVMVKSLLIFSSGAFDATAEVLRINYSQFNAVFPNSNPKFWDAKLSQGNKWKNGDASQGEKFPFSSTALVWTTDGYHLMRTCRNVTMITAIVIPIGGKRKHWKQYAAEGVIYYVSYTAGFSLMYNLIYKMP